MPITPEALHFLTENVLRDSKTWYNDHRQDYQRLVKEPMVQLASELLPAVLSIDAEITSTPARSISRLYRDTRFTKDKSLFRSTVWCSFFRDKKRYHNLPGFFFEFSPTGFRYGCGYYYMEPAQMQLLRDMMQADAPLFRAAFDAFRSQATFTLSGDSYKRLRYPHPDPALQDWLNRKEMCFLQESRDFDLLFSPALGQEISRAFLSLAPHYRFLLRAAELDKHPDSL